MTGRQPDGSMTEALEPGFVAETLAWCNERRAEKGMEPLDRLPKGDREDPASCPCGKATGLWVDNRTFGPTQSLHQANPLPQEVIEFVEAFDGGDLPQYDEHPEFYEEDEDAA